MALAAQGAVSVRPLQKGQYPAGDEHDPSVPCTQRTTFASPSHICHVDGTIQMMPRGRCGATRTAWRHVDAPDGRGRA